MNKLVTLSIAILSYFFTIAQPPESLTKKGMTFGAKTSEAGAVSVNVIQEKINSEQETEIKVNILWIGIHRFEQPLTESHLRVL